MRRPFHPPMVLRGATHQIGSDSMMQEVDRIQQQLVDQIADLETAVASRDQQIDELRSELSDIVSRLEAVESG